MRLKFSHCSPMYQRRKSGHLFLPEKLHLPSWGSSVNKEHRQPPSSDLDSVYEAWLASRTISSSGNILAPGTQRPLSVTNAKLAVIITKECAYDLFGFLWALNPIRTTLMMAVNLARSLVPACRGYSQALIIDELQALVASGNFTWSRLSRLVVAELVRRMVESTLESFALANESLVGSSAKSSVEYKQMEQRIRLDLPTLADPVIRDLLHESDLFVRSFNGMGGFGLISPLEFVNILALLTEVASHLWVIFSLTNGILQFCVLLLSVFSVALPLLFTWFGFAQSHPESLHSPQEIWDAQRQEKLRGLAYSDAHRPEVILFGLGPWILRSWSRVRGRQAVLTSKQSPSLQQMALSLSLSTIDISDFTFAFQNIPLILVLQSSSVSLGSLTLYRSSIQSVILAVRNLLTTTRMAFQGIFLMGAFCAAMKVEPRLQPKKEEKSNYCAPLGGMKFEARNLRYTYPGSKEPALRNINFKLNAGETLAIVGYNGSGKSTLAKILLRILDFDTGHLLVNDVDIRRYNPPEYHTHIASVSQGFSKFNSTIQENIGVGYVENIASCAAVEDAVRLAGAEAIVDSLPNGLRTKMETGVFDCPPFPGSHGTPEYVHHGLSGGEWQRIAISRAFMRASRQEVDLLLFDEPTSSLDAHAQREVFNTIENISRSPSGERLKTVIFITHRLSTARRADKIAMMENGTISEFGSHEDLLRRPGAYATLYHASV